MSIHWFSISFLLNCFKFLGILPLTIKLPRHPQAQVKIRISLPASVLTVVLLILTLIHAIWGPQMQRDFENSLMRNSSAEKIVPNCNNSYLNVERVHQKIFSMTKILYPLLGSFSSIAARFFSLFEIVHSLPILLNLLCRVDNFLLPFPSHQSWKNFRGLLLLLAASIVLHVPILVAHWWHVIGFINLGALIWQALSILNVLTSFLTDLQFILLCWSVHCRFVRINQLLQIFTSQEFRIEGRWKLFGGIFRCWKKFTERRKRKISLVGSRNDSNIFFTFSESNGLTKGNFKKIFESKANLSDLTMTTTNFFKALRISHCLLHDALERINDTYQAYLLVSIMSSLSKVLANIYFIIFGSLTKTEIALKNGMPLSIIWCTYYCFRFVVIVVFAHFATVSSRQAGSILCKIDRRNFEISCREEIKMFFHHLSRRNFEFSACGLFNLNMSLISTSLSTTVTYVVIMAQLH